MCNDYKEQVGTSFMKKKNSCVLHSAYTLPTKLMLSFTAEVCVTVITVSFSVQFLGLDCECEASGNSNSNSVHV